MMLVTDRLPHMPTPWTFIEFKGVEIAINRDHMPMAFDGDVQMWKEIMPHTNTVLVYDRGFFFNA